MSTTGNMFVGQASNSSANDTANATGILNIGDAANASDLTVGGNLFVARQLANDVANMQVVVGTVTVDNAASVLTVNGNLSLTTQNANGDGTAEGTLTITDGTAVLNGDILDAGGTSAINVNGGRLNLADATAAKAVDTLTFGDGVGTDTIEFALNGLTTAVATTTTTIGAAGATVDLTTAAADSISDNATNDTWTGGNSDWDTGSNWDQGFIPNGVGGVNIGDSIDLVTGTISGGTAVLDPSDAGSWTLSQTPTALSVTATADIAGSTVVAATISGPGSIVGEN